MPQFDLLKASAISQIQSDLEDAVEADRILAQTAADDASDSAEEALASETQASLAALAAGAPIVTTLTDPVPANGTVELLKLDAGLQVYEVVAGAWVLRGWLVGPTFDTVQQLLDNTATTLGPDGQIIEAGGFRYEVAASGATDHHVTTAGGVKLYVMYGDDGRLNVKAFGAVGDNVTDDTTSLNVAGATGKSLRLTAGKTYLITDTITFLGNVDYNNATIRYDGPRDRAAVVHGASAARNDFLTISNVSVNGENIDWATRECVGVTFYNVRDSNITISEVARFTTGVRWHSLNAGITHNNIAIESILACKYFMDFLCDGISGGVNYFNENNFWGGNFTSTSETDLLGDCYGHVYRSINGGYTNHNNNRFYGPCFQMGDGQSADERIPVLMDQVSRLNRYYRARYESGRGVFARLEVTASGSSSVSDNIFEVGYLGGSYVVAGITQNGGSRNNQYLYDKPYKQSQTHRECVVDVFRSIKAASSTTAKALAPLDVIDSSGNILQSVSGLTTRLDSIVIPGPRGVGFWVDIDGGESFVLRQLSDGVDLCRLAVAIFDADGARLTDASAGAPHLAGNEFGEEHPWSASYGGVYRMGSDNEEFPFRVTNTVRRLFVFAAGGNLKSLSLLKYSGSRCHLVPYSSRDGASSIATVESGFHTSPGVVGLYQEGEILPIRSVSSTLTSYYQCSSPGRLASNWAPSTTYTVDDVVANADYVYRCVTAGTSATSGGPTGTSTGIIDGTVTWDYFSLKATFIAGPSAP